MARKDRRRDKLAKADRDGSLQDTAADIANTPDSAFPQRAEEILAAINARIAERAAKRSG
jgi:hypothetical protein